jgi:hypothetical protein
VKNTRRTVLTATAALAVLLIAAPARAAVYELASEWMTVGFTDGGKELVLFTHLPDSDIFLHMTDYVTDASSKTPSVEISLPLQELIQPDAGAGAQGFAKSLVLTSRPTSYKMLVRMEREHQRFVISRPPDFTTYDNGTSATILSVFGVRTQHPDSFLVMVLPEQPAGPAPGLSDIELAAVKSLDASERTALVGQCGGEPGAPEAIGCWHAKISDLLTRHQAEAPSQVMSSFEQRYLQNRLSKKGYEQFQSLRSSPGDGDKLSLASDWHQMILDQDIAANAAAAVKLAAKAKAPASVPAAKKPAPAPAPVPVAVVQPVVQSSAAPAAKPEPVPASEPGPARWKIVAAVVLVAAVAALLFAVR